MDLNNKLLTKMDCQELYTYWAKLFGEKWAILMGDNINVHLENARFAAISESCGIMPGTLDSILTNKFVGKLNVEVVLSLMFYFQIPIEEIIPDDFAPSGSRQVGEVIHAILEQKGEMPIIGIRAAIAKYFSMSEDWANAKLIDVICNDPKVKVIKGLVQLNEES